MASLDLLSQSFRVLGAEVLGFEGWFVCIFLSLITQDSSFERFLEVFKGQQTHGSPKHETVVGCRLHIITQFEL